MNLHIKKISALALALLLLTLSLVGCGTTDSQIPEGMQAAHLAGEPFRLYVPEGWSLNDAAGVSGAYSFATERVIANARYHRPDDPELTPEEYLLRCAEGYATSMDDFEFVSLEADLLGGEPAECLVYTATVNDVAYTCTQYTTLYDGLMISLYLYTPTDSKELTAESFEQIRANFAFDSLSESEHEPLVDDNTPDGMQIASGQDAAHRLYVPNTWICDPESGRSVAYYPESGRPNVSITLYSPNESMTPEDYFDLCAERYEDDLLGYELLSEDDCRMAGRSAKDYTYTASYDGVDYKLRQVIFSDGTVIYSLTYTALADRFDAHAEDVEAMIEAFTFR